MTQEPPVCDCPSYTALEGRNVVLRAELERLKHDLHHYDALQTAFHNVNKLVEEQEAEIERLKAENKQFREQVVALLEGAQEDEAEIEQLRRLVDEREADLGRMHGETRAEIERLTLENWQLPQAMTREPDDYFTGACPTCGQAYLRAEIDRLTDAVRRIDGINDYPANYSPAINAICDAILRPHLEPKPFIAADDEKRVDELLTRAKKFGKMTLGDVEKLIERQEAEIERLKAENAALRAKPCSRCGLWPEPKDPCADMACPAGTKP